MRVSLKWLSEYVDLRLPPEELAQRLTMAGLAVDAIVRTGGDWGADIRVAHVTGVDPHPNADRLRLASVDVGGGEHHRVVCGAPNLAVGQKIAFATVGARVRDGHSGKPAVLKPAVIRGVESAGMVLSEYELGISDDHEGILVLPPDAPVGTPLAGVMGDTIFELSVTPNRADWLSVLGIAREVAALTGETGARAVAGVRAGRAADQGAMRRRDQRARPVPSLHRHGDHGHQAGPVAGVDAGTVDRAGATADQQRR